MGASSAAPAQTGSALGSTFRVAAVCDGDVILVYGRPKQLLKRVRRSLNVLGQRLLAAIRKTDRISLFAKLPSHSHAMLGVGGGLVIHADGKRVSLDIISEELRFAMTDASTFQVYRHKDLSPEIAQRVMKAAYRYYSQDYGFLPYFGSEQKTTGKKEDTTQFCSRLVAYAFRSAGVAVTTLPDAKVLPLDLYRICQKEPWQNVSAEFVEEPLLPSTLEVLGKIDVPGFDGTSAVDFFKRTDELMREAAGHQKELLHHQHKTVQNTLRVEGLLGQFVALQLQLARAVYKKVETLDETAAEAIVSVLAQLGPLLDLANLPSLDLLVPELSPLYAGSEADQAAFVGAPPLTIIREMQCNREAVRIYAYLLFGEIGMSVIAAHRTGNVKFERFKVVKPEFAERFFAAAQPVDNLDARLLAAQDGFAWIESDSDRQISRSLASNIAKLLQLLDILKRSSVAAG